MKVNRLFKNILTFLLNKKNCPERGVIILTTITFKEKKKILKVFLTFGGIWYMVVYDIRQQEFNLQKFLLSKYE